jgi:tetratricopeptide (TPR) repeat protein
LPEDGAIMGRLDRILNKADNFKETGRFHEALRELTKALKIAPHDPDVYLSFALTYDAMGELETSIFYFGKALELDSSDPYIWTQCGITFARLGQHKDAFDAFERALTIEPNYAMAKWNLALTYRAIGCYEDAISEFISCTLLDSDQDYIKEEIHYQLGLCYFDMGWTSEALKELKKHVDLFPGDMWAQLSIGNCYLDLGWVDESMSKYKEIISLCPDFVAAYNSLAFSMVEKGWYDEALEVLRMAQEVAPEDESIKENIDYIQSLKDDEDGFKGLALFSVILRALNKKQTLKNPI